jgi:hypothetical protein
MHAPHTPSPQPGFAAVSPSCSRSSDSSVRSDAPAAGSCGTPLTSTEATLSTVVRDDGGRVRTPGLKKAIGDPYDTAVILED